MFKQFILFLTILALCTTTSCFKSVHNNESQQCNSSYSSTNNSSYLSDIKEAQQIQTIYFEALHDPDNIEKNKLKWINIYNKDIIDRALYLYNKNK